MDVNFKLSNKQAIQNLKMKNKNKKMILMKPISKISKV